MDQTNAAIFVLLALLTIKHVGADFVFQSGYILKNRRYYGHPAGLLHVIYHMIGSLVAFVLVGTPITLLAVLLIVEAVLHYHIDWAKDNYVLSRGLTKNDGRFWFAIGADQMLHHLTYIGLVLWWSLSPRTYNVASLL